MSDSAAFEMETATQQSDSTKHCSKCGKEKPRSEFHRFRANNPRPRAECKDCHSAESKRQKEARMEKRGGYFCRHCRQHKPIKHFAKRKGFCLDCVTALRMRTEKKCATCGEIKPRTAFFKGKYVDGLAGSCAICQRRLQREAMKKKPDYYRRKSREFRQENAERVASWQRQWRVNNPQKVQAARFRQRHGEGREAYLAKRRAHRKTPKGRDEMLSEMQRRRKNPAYRIHCQISAALNKALKRRKTGRKTLDLLGYDPVPALLRMGVCKPGMSIDHVIPVTDFLARVSTDYDTPETALRAAWRLGNLRVIPLAENVAKGAKRTLLC